MTGTLKCKRRNEMSFRALTNVARGVLKLAPAMFSIVTSTHYHRKHIARRPSNNKKWFWAMHAHNCGQVAIIVLCCHAQTGLYRLRQNTSIWHVFSTDFLTSNHLTNNYKQTSTAGVWFVCLVWIGCMITAVKNRRLPYSPVITSEKSISFLYA